MKKVAAKKGVVKKGGAKMHVNKVAMWQMRMAAAKAAVNAILDARNVWKQDVRPVVKPAVILAVAKRDVN